MTREEKIAWAEQASIEALLNQYERSAERYQHGAEYIEAHPGMTTLEELEDEKNICRAEITWRMTAGKEVRR